MPHQVRSKLPVHLTIFACCAACPCPFRGETCFLGISWKWRQDTPFRVLGTRNALPHTKSLLSSCLLFKNHTALCGVAFVSRLSISEGLHNLQVYLDSQH